VKQINVLIFQFKLPDFMTIHHVLHVSLLRQPYHVFIIVGKIHDPPSPIENDGEHGYRVKDILDSRIFNRQLQYFVHWHGDDMRECIWEPIKNLSNMMEMVHKFHQQYPNKPKFAPHGTCHWKGK
jgi:hypothetical protein